MAKMDKAAKLLIDKLKGDTLSEFSLQIRPNEQSDEIYLLTGSQPELMANASLLLAFRQLLEEKSLGTFVGEPYESWIVRQHSPLTIQVHFRLKKQPPWESWSLWQDPKLVGRSSLPRPRVTIPNVSKAAAGNWEAIKLACGGSNGYTWGHCYAVANILSKDGTKIGKGNQIKVFASSESEAKTRLKALMALSQYTNFTLSTGEEDQTEGQRAVDAALKKPTIRIYPAFYYIHNGKLVEQVNQSIATLGPRKGRATAAGRKLSKQGEIPLWPDLLEDRIKQKIEDLLAYV